MNASVTTPSTPPPALDTRAVAAKPLWRRIVATRAAAILLLDVFLFLVFTALSNGHVFASVENMQSLMVAGTEALLLAVGLCMLLGAGIFDLSLGSNLVLSSVVGATLVHSISKPAADGLSFGNVGPAIAAGFVACALTGMAFGAINGFLVAYLQINALIATLGTLGVGMGLAYVITNGADISGLTPDLQKYFGLSTFGPVPFPAIVAVLIAGLLYLVVRYLRFGMRTLAIGSSRSAADRAGIKVTQHLMRLTVIAGLLAGLAGFFDIAHYASTAVSGHSNDALNAVTAAVLGGTLLEGGRISILGAIWGTALGVILQGGLVIVGVSSYYQLIVVGLVLIVAVGLDRVTYLRRQKA
jgi:ribose transport system permease protein